MISSARKVLMAVLLFSAVNVVGMIGYMVLEGADPVLALYMTIITVATVGFNEVIPLDGPGRIFTMILILAGITSWTMLTVTLVAFLVEGEFQKLYRRQWMQRRIVKMKDHYIICGLGQVGRAVLSEFMAVKAPCLVIERNPAVVEEMSGHYPELLAIVGDATDDEVLEAAHVERARGLIAATESDSDNLLVALTARSKNKNIIIAARATRTANYDKLRVAGADHVIMPNVIGGLRMAATLLRPQVVDFLDVMVQGTGEQSLRMEQVSIPDGSPMIGMTLQEADIPRQTGLLILAIKRAGKDYIFSPTSTERFVPGDVLIVLGRSENIPALFNLSPGPRA